MCLRLQLAEAGYGASAYSGMAIVNHPLRWNRGRRGARRRISETTPAKTNLPCGIAGGDEARIIDILTLG